MQYVASLIGNWKEELCFHSLLKVFIGVSSVEFCNKKIAESNESSTLYRRAGGSSGF